MAEWLMRGTVNTFFRGSIPLDTYLSLNIIIIFFYLLPRLCGRGGATHPSGRRSPFATLRVQVAGLCPHPPLLKHRGARQRARTWRGGWGQARAPPLPEAGVGAGLAEPPPPAAVPPRGGGGMAAEPSPRLWLCPRRRSLSSPALPPQGRAKEARRGEASPAPAPPSSHLAPLGSAWLRVV